MTETPEGQPWNPRDFVKRDIVLRKEDDKEAVEGWLGHAKGLDHLLGQGALELSTRSEGAQSMADKWAAAMEAGDDDTA